MRIRICGLLLTQKQSDNAEQTQSIGNDLLASARGIAQTAPPHLTSLEVGVRAVDQESRIKNWQT